MASEDVEDKVIDVRISLQPTLHLSENRIARFEICIVHFVAVIWICDTVMFHGLFEGIDVIHAGRQVTHELLTGPCCQITIHSLFDGVKFSSTEVDHEDLVVEEEVFLNLILYGIRNIHINYY